ncbi:MAG: acetyl-CoA carboxylase biotin carboxylase subunit [Planctomycetota bacterium]|nr:acetyl-CoA carboxylase biotin carboxylase subunit [Planctomycetota bacterium]MEE3297876.1 acetyl-CoA carboxylase biotin carboxylase subunit [Planctomycetota bacterium]
MKKFSRILIANRGEIALRILRACRELGIESVIVHSVADAGAGYLDLADRTVCIGPGPSQQSYLDISRIIAAAEVEDVDAIHPGYGFLAENVQFAEICKSSHIEFIGPGVEAIAFLGDKGKARELAREVGVPCVPGSTGILENEDEALKIAQEIGYPVIVKAVAGGGGRGMRVAHNDITLKNGYSQAKIEAETAFNNPDVYLEKYVEKPRHVEIQILADHHGEVVHLGERDCSLQRRHQKLIEESPSPGLPPEVRDEMGAAAKKLVKAAGYTNAGTVEFIVDKDFNFYFIEVNTRIQVEHPVTEMVTGVDLIKEQIRLASGERLGMTQDDIKTKGVAIECRINAEDPADNFRPCPGKIGQFRAPGGYGVRLDTHAYAGYTVPPNYDSMIAKLIVYQETREEAINCMRRCLDEFVIEGISTTIPLAQEIFKHLNFVAGKVNTGFIEEYFLD